MMMNERTNTQQTNVSPCEGCERPCNYIQCRDYRLWLNRCWNRYRHWQDRKVPQPRREDVWQYPSPAMVQRYLDNSPCTSCPIRPYCPDDRSCGAYDQWQSLRWERLRHRLGLH